MKEEYDPKTIFVIASLFTPAGLFFQWAIFLLYWMLPPPSKNGLLVYIFGFLLILFFTGLIAFFQNLWNEVSYVKFEFKSIDDIVPFVMSQWGGYFIFIVFGSILPLINCGHPGLP